MSRIRANNIVNGAGTGAPTFPNGAVINGITTITADVATTGNNLTIGTGTTISNPSNNEFRILTNGSERIRVDSSGNVGIGTEEPTKALHISQNSDVAIRLQARNANVDNTSWEIVVGGNASNNAEMVFRTRNDAGTGGSEIARFTTGGDLKFPSGGGIDFSATSDGGTSTPSELLDDYEEGSWDPQVRGWNGSYSISEGRYIKIGRKVHIIGEVKTDANVGNSFTDSWPGLSNLPFVNTTSFQGVSGSQRHMGTGTILGDVSPDGTNGIAFVTFDRYDGTSFFPNHISSGGARNFQNTMINNPTTVDFGYRFNCTYYTD